MNKITRSASQRGFTMVELIVVMIVVGIMAVAVVPRMSLLGGFDARGYADQIEANLRFAQMSALAKRRMVSLDLSATTNQFCVKKDGVTCDATCNTAAAAPNTEYALSLSNRPPGGSSSFTSGPGNVVCFDALGSPYSTTAKFAVVAPASVPRIVVKEGSDTAKTIYIEPETGYIHGQP